MTTQLVPTPDGRVLEVLDTGGSGLPCLFHGGTPGGPVALPAVVEASRRTGLRWITYARPGYAGSTPLPGRDVAQAASDARTVLDALGVGEFVTYGWSGGGPHALACGALLADRCRAVAAVASVAPYAAPGLHFLAGMGEDNVEEFTLVLQGRDAVRPWLEAQAGELRQVSGSDVARSLETVISDVDRAALTGELADHMAASFRAALREGVDGWLDDDLAFVADWGFPLDDLRVPLTLWQGGQDLMVPLAHGQWLAQHLPAATAQLLPEHGHLSVAFGLLPEILDALAAA